MHSFGIGNDCDRNLVKGSAKAGRGSYSFVRDGEKELNKLVVKSLARSIEPSLQGCHLSLVAENKADESKSVNIAEDLGEVFRNDLIFRSQIFVSRDQFESLKFGFTCERDPLTREPFSLEFSSTAFKEITERSQVEGMFKMAAYR